METFKIDHSKATLSRIVINRTHPVAGSKLYHVMYPISRRLEYEIDKLIETPNALITLESGVPIPVKHIEAYGEFCMFSPSDYSKIKKIMTRASHYEPFIIPKDYDYKSNTSKSNINGIMHRETFSFGKAFKYYHALIGKPDRVLIVRMDEKYIKQTSSFRNIE